MLLQNDRIKISSDISRRFIFKKSLVIRDITQKSDVWKSSILTRGEWIFVDDRGLFYAGMIINFQNCDGKTKSKRLFSHDELNLEENVALNISVLLQPLLTISCRTFSPSIIINKYFPSTKYICHIKSDEIDLKTRLKDVMDHYNAFLKKNV